MAKKPFKINKLRTNVRYIKAKKKCARFFLSALWQVAPNRTKHFVLKQFFKPLSHPLTPLEKQYIENGTSFLVQINGKEILSWKWGL